MFCPNCGTQLVQGATYCSQCGRPATPNVFSQNTNSYPATQPTSTSGLAIGALIMSLVFPIVGLIMGYLAKKEVRNSQGRLSGDGLATAAIVIGWIFTVIGALLVIIGVAALISASSLYY